MSLNVIQNLKLRLKKPLPGALAQKQMAPNLVDNSRFNLENKGFATPSGVMLLLYQENEEIKFPLIRRPEYNGAHSGQISFPGGKLEGNETLIDTALRETQEEIGVSARDIEIIGTLTELYIPASNFKVRPVVGFIDKEFKFIPDNQEVAEVIVADVERLLNDPREVKTLEIERPPGNVFTINTPFFNVDGHVVWGATAMMLSEFLFLINELK